MRASGKGEGGRKREYVKGSLNGRRDVRFLTKKNVNVDAKVCKLATNIISRILS